MTKRKDRKGVIEGLEGLLSSREGRLEDVRTLVDLGKSALEMTSTRNQSLKNPKNGGNRKNSIKTAVVMIKSLYFDSCLLDLSSFTRCALKTSTFSTSI